VPVSRLLALDWYPPDVSVVPEALKRVDIAQVTIISCQNSYSGREGHMYATVRRYDGVTDPGEAGRRVKEGFVPIIGAVPGMLAYYWVDAGNGVMVSTSVFESRDGAEESNRKAADWVTENLASLLPNPPQITAGEVVAHRAV
jgi:hypothetical protein